MDGLVRVGGGRGFLVEGMCDRLIVTAAHCLPKLPPIGAAVVDHHECTYFKLIGALGKRPTIAVQCLFADPVGDIAILGGPDDQTLFDEAEAYEDLVGKSSPLSVTAAPGDGIAKLIALDGRSFQCKFQRLRNGPIWLSEAERANRGGMSGSPILTESGSAMGVVCVGDSLTGNRCHEGGPNPALARNLPGWLLRELGFVGLSNSLCLKCKKHLGSEMF